jgi:hypothetical protein
MELNLKYIKVGHKRTIILQDEANWCTNQKVIAKTGWQDLILLGPLISFETPTELKLGFY